MNKKNLKIFILLFTSLISILFPPILSCKNPDNKNGDVLSCLEINKIPKKSEFLNLTGITILIDDDDPNFNWTKVVAENNWCSGAGTWNNPYVIENITINSVNYSSCIEIRNSDAYFIIKNCEVFNSGSYTNIYEAGIKINNTDNGKLINNNCSFNQNGIFLEKSQNITISGNFINNNDKGIYLRYSKYNNISCNNIVDNTGGICLFFYSDDNSILKNSINNNYAGIEFHSINDNNVSENTIQDNTNGIVFIRSNDNTISGNIINNNRKGIEFWSCAHNNISGNTVRFNYYAVNLINSHINYIIGNILTDNYLFCICENDECRYNKFENNFCFSYTYLILIIIIIMDVLVIIFVILFFKRPKL